MRWRADDAPRGWLGAALMGCSAARPRAARGRDGQSYWAPVRAPGVAQRPLGRVTHLDPAVMVLGVAPGGRVG